MISFAAPWALAGLSAALIPILLHLFARRVPPTVEFPAVRYLSETARSQQHRLNLRHWLLLLARTLLIVALVLAAAGPSRPSAGGAGHVASALVLVVDNSPSSGVTAGGVPMIGRLRQAAAEVLRRATPDDVLWLLTADGSVRRGTRSELAAVVDGLAPDPRRLDLGQAIGQAREVLSSAGRPGTVVVLSDLQVSALAAAAGSGPLLVARPGEAAVANAGVRRVEAGPEPWTGLGGRVSVEVAGSDTSSVPLSVTLGNRPSRQALAAAGRPATLVLPSTAPGWQPLTVELAPDELRADDRWVSAVRVAPPAGVRWDPSDRYLAAACEVLHEGRRITPGGEVTLGSLGAGPSVVLPPADPAQVGALNRSLAARGIPWRYGDRIAVPLSTDSSALMGQQELSIRQQLVSTGSGESGVLATAGGAPWIVQAGNVVLVGSRFDPTWTRLPLTAAFVPLLDALLNRQVRGGFATLHAAPGDAVTLPDRVDGVALSGTRVAVEGGATFRPWAVGVHFLLTGRDTIGVLAVNPDARESALARASDAQVKALWPGARMVPLERAGAEAFGGVARADLRGPLLWLALLVGAIEVALAGWRRRAA